MMSESKFSRRNFLKKTAVAAGAVGFPYIIASSALGKAGTVAPSNRITIGMVGVGKQGTEVNLKNFLGQPDAQVLAVCDVDKAHLGRAYKMVCDKYGNKDCDVYNDFREVIGRGDIDAVVISTPDHWHTPISMAAIKAGKDVMCEKPTLTIKEGRILSEAVRRYGRVFQWATEDRSIYVYHRMAELVRNGRIGKVGTIRVDLWSGYYIDGGYIYSSLQKPEPVPEGFDYDMWLGPAQEAPYTAARCHRNFRWILDYSGGMLTDWGAHLLDTAQWGNDTEHTGPIEIDGKGIFPKEGLYNTAEEYHIEYKYANGVRLIISSGGCGIRFEGSEGWVGNTGWRGNLEASSESILESVIGPSDVHLYTCRFGEHRNFLDCVRSRKDPYFPAEVGHRCFTILHLGNISMLLGRKLQWDPEREICVDDVEANRMLLRPMRSPWHL
ncbi:MAG: Gfo/Idh/MocA family oxidoreductase [Planctomycetota bacterium]|jgi:predicted dehydrogenase